MAHFVECLTKMHSQAIGLSAYIQVVCDVIDKLHQLLHNLNPHKAAGPDNITPRDLKDLSSEVSSILTLIFKKSYDTGDVSNMEDRICLSYL
jgi:hypothetical protein